VIETEEEARAFVAARCDTRGLERLDRLARALADENQRQNLVAAASLETVWQRHIADSAQLLDLADDQRGPWVDLGTGAGFPGLVIAAMCPDLEVILIESRRMRIEWLGRMAREMELNSCRVEGRRLEVVPVVKAGVISARAFAPLAKTIALAHRFSTSGTVWLLPKGRSAAQEVDDLPLELRSMFHVEHSVTDAEAGIVVGRIAKAGEKALGR
jgi:16S rRNA (guanine527-N7)-methyltransferase